VSGATFGRIAGRQAAALSTGKTLAKAA
jgi:hypothetical protein